MKHIVFATGLVAAITAAPLPASATTGKGCLRPVNIPAWDVLNVRAKPNANSRIVTKIDPQNWGVIHLDGPCTPRTIPWGQRWCPITYFDGDGSRRGFVKARFVRDSECP